MGRFFCCSEGETTRQRAEKVNGSSSTTKIKNKEAAARCRQKKKDTITNLTKDVKELKQKILEKDFEIRNLKMRLDSLQENMNQHQRWTPESMMIYQNEQTPVWVLNSPGGPFPFKKQQTGWKIQEQVPVQSQYQCITEWTHGPTHQNQQSFHPVYAVWNPPEVNHQMIVHQQHPDPLSATAPLAPETPIYHDLDARQTPNEPLTYDRSHNLPPTTDPLIPNPNLISNRVSTGTQNLVLDRICIGITPADYQITFGNLMQGSLIQEDQTYDRPYDPLITKMRQLNLS